MWPKRVKSKYNKFMEVIMIRLMTNMPPLATITILALLCMLTSIDSTFAQGKKLDFPSLPGIEIAPPMPEIPDAVKNSPTENENSSGAKCFKLINEAPYTVLGSFYTNYYVQKSGEAGRSQSNFRLKPKEISEFCSYGPFYGEEENRLHVVLRSLIPIFECYVRIDKDVVVHGMYNKDKKSHTWISCD
jgi:hypothetical protein